MTDYLVLTDEDVERGLTMRDAIGAMRRALGEKASGTLVAPPRFGVEAGEGGLVFTVGAATSRERAVGFRVYDTYPTSARSTDQTQLVAVFDTETGAFRGVVIGSKIGAMRTAALDGVALEELAPEGARTLCVIGAGFQARWHLRAALAAREFERVAITNRTHSRAVEWVEELRDAHDALDIEAVAEPEEAVSGADVVICATSSPEPVFETRWLRETAHVTSIGPKAVEGHELPADIVERAGLLVTDSLAQVEGYDRPFFFDSSLLVELDELTSGRVERPEVGVSVFVSTGLAGTEVVLANALLRRIRGASGS
jgi:ornithine cyclodeaminase/alanine dehydrogenase-like protein (mu-crystallin family)